MPIRRVSEKTSIKLLDSPESGMGYQIVKYRQDMLIIFNAIVAIPFMEFKERRFSMNDYWLLSGKIDSNNISKLEEIKIDENVNITYSQFDKRYYDNNLGIAQNETAVPPPSNIISIKKPYSYYRFSPFSRDKRVDPITGNFLPGTYATTYNDIHHVPSGYAAVGRYALPNPASALFIFQLITYDRPSLIGSVTPNYGQAGGGVEIYFDKLARNNPGSSFMIDAG